MENNTGVIAEYAYNKNNVKIKKCCSSCALHNPYDMDSMKRRCQLSKKVVDKSDLCAHWMISDMIDGVKTNGHGVWYG